MKGGLVPGAKYTLSFRVQESHSAAFEGRIIHRVLSTVQLVYYAELAARKLIEPYLLEGEDAAGAGICLDHIAPTRIGDTVSVTAELSETDGKTLVCTIDGVNSKGRICKGSQTQVVITKGSLDRD